VSAHKILEQIVEI